MAHDPRYLGRRSRVVNERAALAADKPTVAVSFACECGSEDCLGSAMLAAGRFLNVLHMPHTYVVAPGHARPSDERLIEAGGNYWLVEKLWEFADEAPPSGDNRPGSCSQDLGSAGKRGRN